jgi:hypothetical protein
MRHIFPEALRGFAKAMSEMPRFAGAENKLVSYEPRPGVEDMFLEDEHEKLDKMVVPGQTVLYTSILKQEDAIRWFTRQNPIIPSLSVVGVIAHGARNFQPYAFAGIMRFLAETGAKVTVAISSEFASLVEYYAKALEFARIGISIEIVDASCLDQENDQVPVVAASSRVEADALYVPQRSGQYAERKCLGKPFAEWEEQEPHSIINCHFSSFPIHMNPGDVFHIMNIVEWLQPTHIIQVNAWKFGMTALLARLTIPYNTQIIAVNSPFIAEQDAPWFQELVARPDCGDRVTLRHIYLDGGHEAFDGVIPSDAGNVLVIMNEHSTRQLVCCAKMVFTYVKKGVVMFHATGHQDCPKFLARFRQQPGVHVVKPMFQPPGGSWFDGGIFYFDRDHAVAGQQI